MAPEPLCKAWSGPTSAGDAHQSGPGIDDIVESSGHKRDLALNALKAVAASFQDLGGYAPHPLRVELMIWKAEIYFRMTSKNYARPNAKAALLKAIHELK